MQIESKLLDVKQVSSLLRVSPRHIYRLSDMGAMPKGIRLGGSRRWVASEIELWLADGCPSQLKVDVKR